MTYAPQPAATIEVKTSYFFLAFLLAIFKPMASIDGTAPFPVGWGTAPVQVPPGQHRVEVWCPYLFFTFMGRSGAVVDVPAGGAVQVAWRAPWLVFLPGKVTVGPAQGVAAQGWAPQQAATPQQAWGAAPQQGWGAAPQQGWAPQAAAPVAVGGWHPDPSGRHEQRYYDGAAWTDHVSDAGVQSTDPTGG